MIPLAKPYFDREEIFEIEKVLSSGMVSGGTPAVREFEEEVQSYLGVKHAIALNSCTAALHVALLALGIKEGHEVIVPAFSYPATSHSVMYCGAKPVFVDIDPRTFNIDTDKIEEKITPRTRAIIPVHEFGQSADMNAILNIAQAYSLFIVEDAACAFGTKYRGRNAGTIGDIGCFSFHARKGITTGEGGVAVTNNPHFATKMASLSNFGIESSVKGEQIFKNLGYNYKMSGIVAAIGIAQLKKLDRIIERKRQLAEYWDERLAEIFSVITPFVMPPHIYQAYVVLLKDKETRDRTIKALAESGIGSQIGTYACHTQPIYKSKAKCPNAIEAYERSLALPMYYELRERDIDGIIDILKKILS